MDGGGVQPGGTLDLKCRPFGLILGFTGVNPLKVKPLTKDLSTAKNRVSY